MRILLIPLLLLLSACNSISSDLLQDDHCLKTVDYEVQINSVFTQQGYLKVHKECLPKSSGDEDAAVSKPLTD